jgi:uncharacterized protein (DUF2235 family)
MLMILANTDVNSNLRFYISVLNVCDELCSNYKSGDEIHLVVFSRGAFTIRIVACFISDFGLLHAAYLDDLRHVYDLWKHEKNADLAY